MGAGVAVVAGAAGFGWYQLAAPTDPRRAADTRAQRGYRTTDRAATGLADIPEGGGVILPDRSWW